MFTLNDDLSIYANRGDGVRFSVTATLDGTDVQYIFQPGDVVRVIIYGKKDAKTVVLQKDFPVTEATESVGIILTKEDTTIGEVISKPKDYWYEVELNPFDDLPQTIIGYDEDGPKVFKLFPEGEEIKDFEPEPEDVARVDNALDMTSTRPIQNQAVARAVARLQADIAANTKEAGRIVLALAVERARIDNLVDTDAALPDYAEIQDIRVDIHGIAHSCAGEAVRTQFEEIEAKDNGGVYALPLRFTVGPTATYYRSQPFPVPEGGMSLRVTEEMETKVNGKMSSIFARVYLGKMENGQFATDSEMMEYCFNGYTNRTYFIPYVSGAYAMVHAIMLADGESQLTEENIADFEYITDYVKVYTGKPNGSGGLLGSVPVTLAKNDLEGYAPDWNFRALSYKYQAMSSVLPLKYVRKVSCPANAWLGAKIYKFDPITRKAMFIKTLHYCENNPVFGTECVIDFEKYGDNYFALLTFGRVATMAEYNSTGFNGGTTGTYGVTNIGLDIDLANEVYVEWLPGAVRSDAWGGSPIVQRNIELLKMNKHKTVPALYVNGDGGQYSYILEKDDFAGVFYGGSYPGGMFFYNVSPATYYTALLNPNSNAYGECDTSLSGFKYGIMCSCFAVLMHGHPIPRSTFDLRYSWDVEGFELKRMNLQADLHKLKPYDIITQGAGQTGHSVLLTGIENVGDMCTALKIMEASTPSTRENMFFLHNGAPYYKNDAETWYQEAYDFMAISDPQYDALLHDKANWAAPYTKPRLVMCNRGYGSVYLEGKTHPILSVNRQVTKLTIAIEAKESGITKYTTCAVADFPPVLKNGYYLVDIMDVVSAGTIRVANDVDNNEEVFHVINVDDYSVQTNIEGKYLYITVTHPEEVKYIEANFRNKNGLSAPMFFRPSFEGNTMKIPENFSTNIGTFAMSFHEDHRDFVNVIYKTEYDTNTFGVDAENDRYV